MNKEKETESNSIEQLNSTLTNAGTKLAENKKIIYWVVGGIVIVAVFIMSYLFIYRNPRLNRSFEAYNQVEIDAAGNDSIAAIKYMKVADESGSSVPGKLAALSAGEALYNEGKYQEAAKYLEKFSSSEPVLDANAKVLLGDCYVNLKKYDDALSCYKKAIGKAGDNAQIVPRVLLKEANIYDVKKDYKSVLACYEQIKQDYPSFQLGNGMTIDAYIERANARLGK